MLFPNWVTVLANRIADFTEEEAAHDCELPSLESIRVRLPGHYLIRRLSDSKVAFHTLILTGDILMIGLL